MSDKLPEIPSLAELGFSEEEIEELEREIAEEEARERGGAGRKAAPGASAAPPAGRPTQPAANAPAPAESASQAPGQESADAPAKAKREPGKSKREPGKSKREAAKAKRDARKAKRKAAKARRDARTKQPRPPKPKRERRPAAAAAPAPWRGLRGPATLLFLLVAAWMSSLYRSIPAPVAATAPDSVFSSARAMAHIERIASEARPPGSPNHARVRDYLVERLGALGHTASVQTATSFLGASTVATVRNVLARIPGTAPGGPAVLVTAHYDSREIALGAADDGAGVVAILETVRALGARAPLRNDLIVLLTDAEELGLLGARAFVDEHPWMEDVAVLLAFEMRGGGGPSMMFETGADNGWVVGALREADPYPAANSVSYEIYRRMPNDTDFTPFMEAGRQGLNFAALGRANVYHQVYDSPENLSEATVQHHGEHALAMLQHFGNADLSIVDAPDVSFLSVPLVGLVTYGPLWIWILGIAALAAWALAFFVGHKGGSRLPGVVVGAAASVVHLLLVAGTARLLFAWRSPAHPELGALFAGSFHSEGWYVLAIAFAAFAMATALWAILRRWFSAAELAVGALFVPVVIAVLATFMFPMAAMNFQWPALAGCVGALAVAGMPPEQRMGLARWLGAVVAAVPVIVVLTPLTEGTWAAMGLAMAAGLGVLLGLAFAMLLPVLDAVREPNGWWAPVAGLLAAGVFLAVGMSTATPSAERPAPSTLVYMLDHESGAAYWGTDRNRDDSDPGVQWASAAVGPFALSDSARPAAFVQEGYRYDFAAADPVAVPPPTVTLVEDADAPGDVLRVAVTSAIGAERMSFALPEDGPRLAAVNGHPLPEGRTTAQLVHWGTPLEGGLLLDFDRPPGDPALTLTIVEHHLRPGELVGAHHFDRPPELAPNVRTLSDRAIIRTLVTIGAPAGEADAAEDAVDPDAPPPGDAAANSAARVGGNPAPRQG